MERELFKDKKDYIKDYGRRKLWKRIVSLLAGVVVFCTTYALILPAITLTGTTYCGKEEHVHGDECSATEFICDISTEGTEVHSHTDSCYIIETNLICPLQETEGHTHSDECMKTESSLICESEETETHMHAEECYEQIQVIGCGQEEAEPHIHSEECWNAISQLNCGLEEGEQIGEVHEHTESCYYTALICEKEEHTHTTQCYSNPNADIETASDWEATLPNELTGIWEDDLLLVAESQLGYEESTENYLVVSGDEKKGYTRYGDWYGDSYGDWCAMYISFCLHYAGIPEDAMPHEANCQNWVEKLKSIGLYETSDNCKPEKGDLIFFEVSKENISNHVGIVKEVTSEGQVKTIEGNTSDKVAYRSYDMEDPDILGYGKLPSNGKNAVDGIADETEETDKQAEDGTKVYTDVADLQSLKEEIEKASEGSPVYLRLSGKIYEVNSVININKGKIVTIDLNGCTMSAVGTNSVFIVNGGSLSIEDSAALQETEPVIVEKTETDIEPPVTNLGEYQGASDSSNAHLIYYITQSEKNNIRTGATTETLVRHEVDIQGKIQGNGNAPIIEVKGNGTFTLNSGALVESTKRAILADTATVNLAGGYICGNSCSEDGGAIYCNNEAGVLNISGTVIAANISAKRGGGIKVDRGTLNITENAVISGNRSSESGASQENSTHHGGGGIFCWNTKLNIDSGYITNNRADATGYFDGGGGILISGNTTCTLNGGYITNNQASSGGGIRTDWGSGSVLNMNGGCVCSNYAVSAEGGGISINMNAEATIAAGYINNNSTNSAEHWGGGGVFCSNGSKLFMRTVLITQNHAMGFGGGVAGCSTGRVYITVNEGGAIYSNIAEGDEKHMSGSASVKNEDHTLALADPDFMENGYQDYFCALNSVVEPIMLGGEPAFWQGSKDGDKVSAGAEETLIASSIMGLSSNPTEAGRNAAEKEGAATLFINGNSSNTHGGGVLANGYLIIGKVEDIKVASRIELSGTKAYYTGDGAPLSMQEGQFKFKVTDANTGVLITTGKNDSTGKIVFEQRLPFAETGTYTYLVSEEQPKDADIVMDTSQYRITISVGVQTSDWYKEVVEGTEEEESQETIIRKHRYLIEKIVIEKKNENDWQTISTVTPDTPEDGAVKLNLTSEATFSNYKFENTTIRVRKEWEDGIAGQESITVHLYQNQQLHDTVELNAENNWTYIWPDLPLTALKDNESVSYIYDVQEEPVPGYHAQYETYNNVSSLSDYEVVYVITNEKSESMTYGIDITKVSADDPELKLEGAHFSLKNTEGNLMNFIFNSSGSYTWTEVAEEGVTTTDLVTVSKGKLVLDGLPAGSYILEETQAPVNYHLIQPMEITLGEETDSAVLTLEIADRKKGEYVLPETGGSGTQMYTTGGMALMIISLLMGYVIRRKRERRIN